MTTIYLCLDLDTKAGVIVKTIDTTARVAELLIADTVQGEAFERNWQCFSSLAAANAYQAEHPTLIVIPLVAADIVPMVPIAARVDCIDCMVWVP